MRGPRSFGLSVLHHRHGDGGEECRQCEKLAGDPRLQATAGLSHRGTGLKSGFASSADPQKSLGLLQEILFGECGMLKRAILFMAGIVLMISAAAAAPAVTAKMKAAVADSSRPAEDTARDVNRKPAEM